TAVRLCAEVVNLKPITMGNVLFVTSPSNAARIQAETDRMVKQAAGAIGYLGTGGLGLGGGGMGGLGLSGGAIGLGGGFPSSGPATTIIRTGKSAEHKEQPAKKQPGGKQAGADQARMPSKSLELGRRLTEL